MKKYYAFLVFLILGVSLGGVVYIKFTSYYENLGYTYSETKGIGGTIVFIIGIIGYIAYTVYRKTKNKWISSLDRADTLCQGFSILSRNKPPTTSDAISGERTLSKFESW